MKTEIEKKWQNLWMENHVFEPNINGKKFFLTVPYPYSNGALHVGHGRTYTYGDIIARYKRMMGYNVLFPMAFHVTGTPILTIADSIKSKNKDVIELYRDYLNLYENDKVKIEQLLKSFEVPENIAYYFAEKIQKDFESIGYSIDWRRKFNTAEPYYNKFVEWQYSKLYEKGYLKKGDYPITYSIADGNPVGEDDIKDGDTDKVSIVEFTAMKFRFEDGFILAGTLRPETIFGVTNIWVNPEAEYVKIKHGNEIYYISTFAAEKLNYQIGNVEIIKKYKGDYFLNKTVTELVNNRVIPILPATFVDSDNATGFVKSVPAHAPYDFTALKDINSYIEPIPVIRIDGFGKIPAKDICEKFEIKDQNDKKLEEATEFLYKEEFYNGIMLNNCGQFSGKMVKDIKDQVREWAISSKLAIKFYETSRKAVTRSGNKVIVAIVKGQWFIDYSNMEWKEKTHSLINRMNFYPATYREKFHDVADWLRERPCVRRRGLGTPFPFEKGWIIESLSDSTIYTAFYTIINKIRESGLDPEELDEKFFDYIFLGEGEARKSIEKELRKNFEYWYPNDLRVSSTAHTSNHFIFFLFHHTAIFQEKFQPGGLMILGMLISEGAKMSKSKGNVIPLAKIAEKYSADLFRLYIVSTADYDTVLDWREAEVKSLEKKLEKFDQIVEETIKSPQSEDLKEMDLYLINKFWMRFNAAADAMENYRFRDAIIELFYNFLNDIKYYEKRESPERARMVLKSILPDWLKSLAPFIPHTCEEYWHSLGKNTFISLEKFSEKKEINKKIIEEVDYVENVLADIKNILDVLGIAPKKIYIYTAGDRTRKLVELAKKDKNLAFKEAKGKEEINILKQVISQRLFENCNINEREALMNAKNYLEKETGAIIYIDSEDDPGKKKNMAIPGKPSIYISK
ncbi:MAG: leucine--tRNA ligase [Thermoplasmata archaeon]